MAGHPAATSVLPRPCASCGGELRLDVREPARVLERCLHCGRRAETAFRPSAEAVELLTATLRDRSRLRRRLALARPMILLWIPPAPDGFDPAYRDAAILAAERLAAHEPTLWLREEPYPVSPEDEATALASLADLSLLVAPGPEACERALALLGEVLPPSRATVFGFGLSGNAGPGDDEPHPRLRIVPAGPAEPGGLVDVLGEALARIRRVAWWRALDPSAPPGDPLTVHETHAAAVAAVTDVLCAFLLRLASASVPMKPERLADAAGGESLFESRLQVMRQAGLLELVRGRIQLTSRGRDLLDRLFPGHAGEPARRPSTLARLFDEARTGNQDALGRLLKTGGEQARIVARRRLGPALRAKVDSIDISQSVVVDLMKGLDRFEYRSEPAWRGYLRRLVENKIRAKADYFGAARRDMKRERSIETRGGTEENRTTEPPADSPSPSERLLREEEIGNLERALDQMSAAERDVIILRVFEGLSHREIARRLGRPSENAVHKLYGRALARLADLLGRSA